MDNRLPDAQAPITIAKPLIVVMARMNRIPTFRSTTNVPTPIGINANTTSRGTAISTGARL